MKATEVGLWTQECTYNIYSKAYEAKKPKTTCLNKMVIYGKPKTTASSITWQNDVLVTYDKTPERRMLEGEEGFSGRSLVRSDPDDWWAPERLDYSNSRWISGTGTFITLNL